MSRAQIRRLPRLYWATLVFTAVLNLARFSQAFLLLSAQGMSLPLALLPAVMILMNVVYAAMAWPVGIISDRLGSVRLLALGLVVLIVADLSLGAAHGLVLLGLGIALWGLHLGLTEGLLSALVARAAPADLHGSAFGLFYLVSGLVLLSANVLAGGLWDRFGPAMTFFSAAGLTGLALLVLLLLRARP